MQGRIRGGGREEGTAPVLRVEYSSMAVVVALEVRHLDLPRDPAGEAEVTCSPTA